ncbi:hypothetical protein BGX23_010743 [Mortierella sp. AD031]|nr:hypothetical protein BGX23_010743 [Mortierella sp. AD031]
MTTEMPLDLTTPTTATPDLSPDLLSPIFKGVLPWTTRRGSINLNEYLRRRKTAQLFWLLVLQNPGLVRLVTPSNEIMNNFDKEFVITTLSFLKSLRDLELCSLRLNIPTLLSKLLQLERLQVRHWDGLFSMTEQEQYGGLRSLSLQGGCVQVQNLFKALGHLPGLEELKIKAIEMQPYGDVSAFVEARTAALAQSGQSRQDLPLKSFEVDDCIDRLDKHMALVVGQFPRLVRIRIPVLHSETWKALWKHCYYLDEIRSLCCSTDAWRERRAMEKN